MKINEKEKKTKKKKKDATTSMKIDKKKLAYTPKTDKEKADAYAELVRKLKSGELTPNYRWHGGRTLDFGDKD